VTDSSAEDIAVVAQIKAVPSLLDIACRSTGMGFAAVARVTKARWIACAVHDEIDFRLQPAGELPIETTICNEVRESRQLVVIDDVESDPRFCRHPTPALYGFKSYISVPILRTDGSFFGTLCAFDPSPRRLNTPATLSMFETFAELIGHHLSALDHAAVSEASLQVERKTSALRDQFIAVLGHDLRNPLTAILGGMEMLRKNPLNERAMQWADMVVASAGRMAELIDVVMDFSRSQLGDGLIMDCSECNSLEAGLSQMLSALQTAQSGREIRSRLAITAPVQCDQRRLVQLATNLLNNAIHYGDPNRPIHLDAITDKGWFELAVTNAGEPISNALLATIFEPFSRGTGQPSREGLGLGLYISNQIALAHGGSLTVVSTPEQTRFTFRMPLREAA
jgi:signal transduction histidine kinase